MPLTATDSGETIERELTPVGLHHAICTGVYDLGVQYNERFNKHSHKILIQWELPEVRIEIEDKDTGAMKNLPKAASKQYTLSLHEKANLRKDLESWRGKEFTAEELQGFDILNLLGVNCLIQIIHKTTEKKTYANPAAILPLQPGTPKREPENPLRSFSFETDQESPEGTPQWIREIIEKAEAQTHTQEEPPHSAEGGDDSIPF